MASADKDIASLFVTHGGATSGLPPEVVRLAQQLSEIHGDIGISSETGGYHLNMASPYLLATSGRDELMKRHLAVNASMYFGLGEYEDMSPRKRDKCGLCMKSRRPYRVSELYEYPPLSKRGFPEFGAGKIVEKAADRYEIDDGNGNMIPDHPGIVTPVIMLPPEHQARHYLASREGGPANLAHLHKMFGLSWCTHEAPENRDIGRWYAKRHVGWKDTPQGRIIFNGFIRGVRRIWQGRYLEHEDDQNHYVWHPYQQQWIRDAYRLSPQEDWVFVPPFDLPFINGAGTEVKWKPSKYINAHGSQRGEWGILGYDAAVEWNKVRNFSKRFAVLGEGPMDAGRFGPPGVAGIGSYLSMEQARLLAGEFSTVICAQDSDAAGERAREVAHKVLSACDVRLLDVTPLPGKDFGAMTTAQCWATVLPLMKHL